MNDILKKYGVHLAVIAIVISAIFFFTIGKKVEDAGDYDAGDYLSPLHPDYDPEWTEGFDPSYVAAQFEDLLDSGFLWTGSSAFREAMKLLLNPPTSDSELIAINDEYYNEYGITLRTRIEQENVITDGSIELRDQVYDRLAANGL